MLLLVKHLLFVFVLHIFCFFKGSTAYVLSLDGMKYQLWNASTGECYELSDVRCPLQSIGCLIDETNVSYLKPFYFCLVFTSYTQIYVSHTKLFASYNVEALARGKHGKFHQHYG